MFNGLTITLEIHFKSLYVYAFYLFDVKRIRYTSLKTQFKLLQETQSVCNHLNTWKSQILNCICLHRNHFLLVVFLSLFRSLWEKESINNNLKYVENFQPQAAIESLQSYRYSLYVSAMQLEGYSSILCSKNIPLEQGINQIFL